MKKITLSPRVVEYAIGILATGMIAVGLLLYFFDEPERIVVAQENQIYSDLDEAMTLYAENCSVCHGLTGEGIGATPALDNSALRGSDYNALTKIIGRGLFGTAMPAWSKEDGGPLNEYQISEMVTLIQYGDWQATQDRVVNLGLAPLVPFTSEPDPAILEALVGMSGGNQLAEGITLFAEKCVACHGADGLGTALAPALNDPTVRDKTVDELERTILNGVSGTLMAPWQNNLTGDQLSNLVALITHWDEVPAGAIPAPDQTVPVTGESLALGSELYTANCSRCHGPEGQGTPRAPSLNVKSFLADTNDIAMQQIVSLGVPGTAMPAWGDRMTDAEIQAIVGFIRSWEPTAPEVAEPARGGGPWWQTDTGFQSSSSVGGPPWMRNPSTAPQESNALSSGSSVNTQASSGHVAGGTGAAQGNAAGNSGESTINSHQSGGGGPPWTQTQQQPTIWYQELDWRVVILLGGVLGSAMLMVGLAVFKLHRLAV